GFALVGNPDCRYITCRYAGVLDGCARSLKLRSPNFFGIVLDPPRLREVLGKLFLGKPANRRVRVENDGTRTGGALIERKNKRHETVSSEARDDNGVLRSRLAKSNNLTVRRRSMLDTALVLPYCPTAQRRSCG